MAQTRVVWIDWAKALLIYLMVLGHAHAIEPVQNVIYGFHMPAFFFVSGYLYRPHDWKQTLRSFFIPVIIFSLCNLLFNLLLEVAKGNHDIVEIVYRGVVGTYGFAAVADAIILFPGVWFVFALVGCRFVMGDILQRELSTKQAVYMLCIAVLIMELLYQTNPHGAYTNYKFFKTLPALPFVLSGYLFHKRMIALPKIWFALPTCIIYVILVMVYGRCDMLGNNYQHSYVVFYFLAMLGSLGTLGMLQYLPQKKVIEVFSIGTLFILGFNFTLLFLSIGIINRLYPGLTSLLGAYLPFVASVFVMAMSYYPIKILLKKAPWSLGKIRGKR